MSIEAVKEETQTVPQRTMQDHMQVTQCIIVKQD